MVDIYDSYFEYGGKLSREYGLIIASMDTSRNLRLSGDISAVTIFNKRNTRNYLVDLEYKDSPISFDVEFFTDDQTPMSRETMRAVEKWLFQRGRYQKLYIDKESDCNFQTVEIIDGKEKRLYFNCRFSNPERIESDSGVIGYKATLENDSAFLWQDPIVKRLSGHGAEEPYIVTVDTDTDDYTYPKITFRLNESMSRALIVNLTDDNETRATEIINPPADTNIVIDSELNYISGVSTEDGAAIQTFPRLLDGENEVIVYGDVDWVEFEFQNRRML